MREKKVIVGYKRMDILAGIVCLVFTITGLIIPETINWPVVIFFGTGTIVLLFKYINPYNRIIIPDSDEAKAIAKSKSLQFLDDKGLLQYTDYGFSNYLDEQFYS